jgi:hypothetical protein
MPRTERRVSSFGQPSWSYFRGDTSFENTTRTLRRPSAASMASTMDLDPGEGCLDLAKVRRRKLDLDRVYVLAQVIHAEPASSATGHPGARRRATDLDRVPRDGREN